MSQFDNLLKERLIANESSDSFAYQDSLGYWTIGVGRCIDKRIGRGLVQSEIDLLLTNDLILAHEELSKYFWYQKQDEVRQGVLIELCFNMGLSHLLGFNHMIEALSKHDYSKASQELIHSKWAKEVSESRVSDLNHRLLTGSY